MLLAPPATDDLIGAGIVPATGAPFRAGFEAGAADLPEDAEVLPGVDAAAEAVDVPGCGTTDEVEDDDLRLDGDAPVADDLPPLTLGPVADLSD